MFWKTLKSNEHKLKNESYTSELLNLSVETMNSIVEDIMDLLKAKYN